MKRACPTKQACWLHLLGHDSGGAGRTQEFPILRLYNLLLDWISYSRSMTMTSGVWVLLFMSKEVEDINNILTSITGTTP